MIEVAPLMLLIAFTVEGATTCPEPSAVRDRLAANDVAFEGRIELIGTGRGLRVRWFDQEGAVVADRELDGGGRCEELADAAATIVTAWTLHVPSVALETPKSDVTSKPTPHVSKNEPTVTHVQPPEQTGGRAYHAVYGEAFGMGLLYSVNYEFRPLQELALRGGVTVFPFCIFNICQTVVGFTPAVYGLLFSGDHHIEAGVGLTLTTMEDDDSNMFVPSIGYRYDPEDGGFLFRATISPLFRLTQLSDVIPWGGISAGYTF